MCTKGGWNVGSFLEMQGIVKRFHGVEVLHGVDFSVERGEVIALCGENGAGKSTLMKILMGIYRKDEGRILLDGVPLENHDPLKSRSAGISMIHQELNLVNQLSIARNLFLGREPTNAVGGIDFRRMNREAAQYLEELHEHVDVTTPVGRLKVAQKQMIEIAKAISSDSKLIVMDEPTAVLTEKETAVLFDTIRSLKARGVSIIYISHRLQEIRQICDRVTILRDGRLVTTRQTSQVTEREIANLMVGREVENSTAMPFDGDPEQIALEVRGVTDDLLQNVSFRARKGEILGFSGLVGAGRTELMEYIFGIRKVRSGELFLNGVRTRIQNPAAAIAAGIGFATEDRKATGIVGIRSIRENINYCYLMKKVRLFVRRKQTHQNAQRMMEALNVVCRSENQPVQDLSGGNQQKVVLAKWTLVDSEILILDEPTRGIDIGAREEIYQIIYQMARSGKTILIISSDLPEILKICPRILVMYEGRLMGELNGAERTEENIIAMASGLAVQKTEQEGSRS